MRRDAATAAGASHVIDPAAVDAKIALSEFLGVRGAEIVIDATGVPAAVPTAMSLACDAGQVVVVGSPRGLAQNVNFYDDLHRRYIEVMGAHGNMLFEGRPHSSRRRLGHQQSTKLVARCFSFRSAEHRKTGYAHHQTRRIGDAYEGLLKKKEEYLALL